MTECGDAGYVVFFGTLEIYSREFNTNLDWKLEVSLNYLWKKLHLFHKKVVIKSLEFIKKSGKWDINFNGDNVTIYIPKFRELLDEFTLRKLAINERKIGSVSGQSPKKNVTELEVDIDIDKDILSKFEIFWKEYPKKKSKGQAEKAWKKIVFKNGLFEHIISKLNLLKTSNDWLKENGQFIPYPATWLNAKGWEDEIGLFTESVDPIESLKRRMKLDNAGNTQ